MKVLVTGASGFVGSHLCEKLLNEGHEVFALVRNLKKFDLLHPRLQILQGNLDAQELSWINLLPHDLNSCIHTAGLVHSFNKDDFFHVNKTGTKNLILNLKNKYSQLQFILISSLAAAGPSLAPEKRIENDLDFPISFYGRSKKDAEDLLKTMAPDSWTFSIIRPPMVIGPKDAAVLDIFKMVQSGFILLPGKNSKEKLYSFVCVFDLTETIYQTLIKNKKALFYSSHPQEITFNDLILEIKKQLNKNFIFYIPLPLFLVRFLALILNFVHTFFPLSFRLTPDKYYELAAINWTCDGTKSEVELSQVYQYDLQKTVAITLMDYKSRNWI